MRTRQREVLASTSLSPPPLAEEVAVPIQETEAMRAIYPGLTAQSRLSFARDRRMGRCACRGS